MAGSSGVLPTLHLQEHAERGEGWGRERGMCMALASRAPCCLREAWFA